VGEWEEERLGDICEISAGGDIPSNNVSQIKTEKFKYPIYANAEKEKGLYGFSDIYKVENECVTVTGRGNLGIAHARKEKFYPIVRLLVLFPKRTVNIKFLAYQINNISIYTENTGVPQLTVPQISNSKTNLTSLSEQTKIATFLSLIDTRISTQIQIIEELKTLIKGIRKRLFPLLSGNLTALRKIADIYQPQTISISKFVHDGNYFVYGANGIIGKYDSYNHELSQICITCRGNTCGTVNYSQPKSYITGNSMVINIDKSTDLINKRFLFHYLSSLNFTSIISGSGQPQIVRQPLANIEIIIPEMEQQYNISNLLDLIQEKINQEVNLLSAYQKQKKYLLQQMFI
jgi:type I restriction enzyme S subunit